MAGVLFLLALLPAGIVASALPVTALNVLFGHAIKGANLPANTETVTFEHNCTTIPCAVTQIHVPSIYPGNGCPWDWENGVLRVYTDGSLTMELTLLQLALVGKNGAVSNNPPADGSPFGNDIFGKTAHTGGVYSTIRIPFSSTLKTTIQASPNCATSSVYWFVIRGVEGMPIVLGGELQLPDQAALSVYKNTNVTLQPEQFITIASAPSNTGGALIAVAFDAASADFNFLEACVRFYPNGAADPIYMSSGTEDYFLSASYYDEGMFKTPQSGVTYIQGPGSVAMYKVHASRDYVLWQTGMNMTWRDMENSCPNAWPWNEEARRAKMAQVGEQAPSDVGVGPDAVSTLVFMYTWPSNAEILTYGGVPAKSRGMQHTVSARLMTVRALCERENRLLTAGEEDSAVDMVLAGHAGISALLDAYGNGIDKEETRKVLARHLLRLF